MIPQDKNEQSDNEDKYKNDGFGHTSWVIPKREFDFQNHKWTQQGTLITCDSCPRKHSSAIPVDRMLVKNEEGIYDIVPVPILT